jgi:hypothetical protein
LVVPDILLQKLIKLSILSVIVNKAIPKKIANINQKPFLLSKNAILRYIKLIKIYIGFQFVGVGELGAILEHIYSIIILDRINVKYYRLIQGCRTSFRSWENK